MSYASTHIVLNQLIFPFYIQLNIFFLEMFNYPRQVCSLTRATPKVIERIFKKKNRTLMTTVIVYLDIKANHNKILRSVV